MCADDRKTLSRGRWRVPLTFARTRTWRRFRAESGRRYLSRMPRSPGASGLGSDRERQSRPIALLLAGFPGLARLPPHHFAGVANPLALVRFGRPHPANPRRFLSDRLLVDPG